MQDRDVPSDTRQSEAQKRGASDPSPYLTVAEVAQVLRTTRKAVYALVERGALPGVRRLGRRLLVNRHELIAWIERCAR